MKLAGKTAVMAVSIVCMLGTGGAAVRAQNIDPARLQAAQDVLSQIQTMLESLPDAHQKLLSSGAHNVLKLAHDWDQVQNGLADADVGQLQSKHSAAATQPLPPDALVSRVNNPATDFLFSIVAGFTQSETSTAWCGNNVVTGFNDSGSVFETFLEPRGLSFSGASYSTDKGRTFQDIGFINPGPDFYGFLIGDPVVTCVPSTHGGQPPVFYYTQLFSESRARLSEVAISKSTDGGATWGDPVAVARKAGSTHFLDKDWSAIDPTNPNRIFVTYTDFDTSSTRCPLQQERTAIELVESVDGGVTWTAPLIVTESCFASPSFLSVQGSQVLFDPAGNAYVAWESFSNPTGSARNLWIRKSTDHGHTFSASVRISSVTYTGDGNNLQGGIRNNEFPMLAVDRNNGTLYAVWNDGRHFFIPDLNGADGRYHFADVLLSNSADGGQTWSAPVRVNQDPDSHLLNGRPYGTDHYQPGVAVDKSGRIGVCWYDRRSDPKNFTFGRFCSFSTDGGANWHEPSSFVGNWQPFHDMDFLVAQYYLGDYDTVASDLSGNDNGFLGAFGFVDTNPQVPNQDVAIIKFP